MKKKRYNAEQIVKLLQEAERDLEIDAMKEVLSKKW